MSQMREYTFKPLANLFQIEIYHARTAGAASDEADALAGTAQERSDFGIRHDSAKGTYQHIAGIGMTTDVAVQNGRFGHSRNLGDCCQRFVEIVFVCHKKAFRISFEG